MGVDDEEVLSPDTSIEDGQDHEDLVDEGSEPSTDADEGDTPVDFLSVVRDAVPEGEEDDDQASASPAEGSDTPSDTDGDNSDTQDAEFGDVPFHKHPRFKQVVQQRNEYKRSHEELGTIQNYLRENGLTEQEAADGLHMVALMKRDPAEAWKFMKPRVTQLLHDAGEVLPQDLQAQVRSGAMTKETAVEVSRLRAQQAIAQRRGEFDQRVSQSRQQHEAAQQMTSAVSTWETQKIQSDPDFGKVQEALQKEVLWLQKSQGMPATPQDAVAMLDKAYAAVKPSAAPNPAQRTVRKPEVKPAVRNSGRAAGATPAPRPKTPLDVIDNALASGGNG